MLQKPEAEDRPPKSEMEAVQERMAELRRALDDVCAATGDVCWWIGCRLSSHHASGFDMCTCCLAVPRRSACLHVYMSAAQMPC